MAPESPLSPLALTAPVLAAFERVETPIWVYDMHAHCHPWANHAALVIWRSPSLDEFVSRDLGPTPEHERTSAALLATLRRGQAASMVRTFMPHGQPLTLRVRVTPATWDGRLVGLVEAQPTELITQSGTPDHSQDLLQQGMDAAPVPLLITACTGEVLRANIAAEALLKRDPDGGGALLTLIRDLPLVDGEHVVHSVLPAVDFVGVVHCRLVTVSGRAARLTALIDLSEQMRHRDELEQARAEAEAGSRAKSAFLATVSHELRTPMNGVLGTLQLLQQAPLSRADGELVDVAMRSGLLLLRLLDDLLEFARAERASSPSLTDFDVRGLVDDVVTLLRADPRAQGIELTVQVPDDVPPIVHADAATLRQVLLNLVGNAVKFTPQGQVGVEVTHDHEVLTVRVRDTGIGIGADDLPHLFNRFTQADSSISRRFGGTGLGLAICKRLVERQGGRIWATSELGVGSTFTFCVPALGVHLPPQDGWTDDQVAQVPPRRVLLVEDNPVNQLVASRFLTALGQTVCVATSGREALDLLAAFEPQVVLMDLHMPGLSGLDTVSAIRAQGGPSSGVPILPMTADGRTETRAACERAGMVGFLLKPLRARDLAVALGTL